MDSPGADWLSSKELSEWAFAFFFGIALILAIVGFVRLRIIKRRDPWFDEFRVMDWAKLKESDYLFFKWWRLAMAISMIFAMFFIAVWSGGSSS